MPRCRSKRRAPSRVPSICRSRKAPVVPVMIGAAGAAIEASTLLEDEGFLVVAIRPPTVPDGTARLRVTFNAVQPDEEIARLAAYRSYPHSEAIMTAIFITAAGTDVGKTFVAAGLIRLLRAKGRAVDAVKPVVAASIRRVPATAIAACCCARLDCR